jgi:nicotinate-nucleotide pyrophosphorylase (carboxylating)
VRDAQAKPRSRGGSRGRLLKPSLSLPDASLQRLLEICLDEDFGSGDLTSEATVPADVEAKARTVAREPLVCAGLILFEPLVETLARRRGMEAARSLRIENDVGDGVAVRAGTTLCEIRGNARALLALERPWLNFVGRLSGIATLTARYVAAVKDAGAKARVLDTRKTTPGHRLLEKYAVRCGGGANHRMGLFDAVLIKDNHIVAAGGIGAAVRAALAHAPAGVDVEVECDRLEQAEEAMAAGATALLLDNFTPARVKDAAQRIDGRARIEVSGGITLESIGEFARAGADDVSIGRLTHSAPSVDVALDFEPLA